MERANTRHSKPVEFKVGEFVWLKTVNLSLPQPLSKKLAAKWIGPYRIVSCVSHVAMKLELP